jgi:hypothetical protein
MLSAAKQPPTRDESLPLRCVRSCKSDCSPWLPTAFRQGRLPVPSVKPLQLLLLLLSLASCSAPRITRWEKFKGKGDGLEAYFRENAGKLDPVEGIYSVSDSLTYKSFVFRQKKHKLLDHYAQVAIVKSPTLKRDYAEVNVDIDKFKKYAVIGEIRNAGNGIYLFTQYKLSRFGYNLSFVFDEDSGIFTSQVYNKPGWRRKKIRRTLYRVSGR